MALSDFAGAYFGFVESIENGHARGWAWLPRRPGYPPLIHALDRSRVVCSALVTSPADAARVLDGTSYRFDLDLSGVPAGRHGFLEFVIGETEQSLPTAFERMMIDRRVDKKITVEDLLTIRSINPWVRGATYHDAIEAGVGVEDIVEIFYKDYLGRSVDPAGLEHYSTAVRLKHKTFEALRSALIRSEEYRKRLLPTGVVPGTHFSDPLIYGPTLPLPGESPASSLPKVSARVFEPLWGEQFLENAYGEICRAPLAAEIRSPLIAMLDRDDYSKLDILRELVASSSVFYPSVELVDGEFLADWPASRHHQVPISALLREASGTPFVEGAYKIICGESMEASVRDGIVVEMLAGQRTAGDVIRMFVAEAHGKRQIPVVIALGEPEPTSVIRVTRQDPVEVVLDKRIIGYGWHKSEQSGDRMFRWMPDTAGLVIPPLCREGPDVVLTVQGYARVDRSVAEGFACFLNGLPVEGRVDILKDGEWSFTSYPMARVRIPAFFPFILSFKSIDAKPFQNPKDRRYLTVALERIRLAPAGAATKPAGDPVAKAASPVTEIGAAGARASKQDAPAA